MSENESNGGAEVVQRYRCALRFSITGDLRFISHHDTLRLFKRALARAALPVRFSEGFNPQPRITLPLPRPVGIASDDETLVVDFTEPIDPSAAANRLQQQMPPDLVVRDARRLGPRERLQPDEVRYRLDLESPPPADLEARIRRIIEAETLLVERTSPKYEQPRSIDIRPYLVDIHLDGDTMAFTLRVTDGGTARPAEIGGLLGFDPAGINHRIHRTQIRWR